MSAPHDVEQATPVSQRRRQLIQGGLAAAVVGAVGTGALLTTSIGQTAARHAVKLAQWITGITPIPKPIAGRLLGASAALGHRLRTAHVAADGSINAMIAAEYVDVLIVGGWGCWTERGISSPACRDE